MQPVILNEIIASATYLDKTVLYPSEEMNVREKYELLAQLIAPSKRYLDPELGSVAEMILNLKGIKKILLILDSILGEQMNSSLQNEGSGCAVNPFDTNENFQMHCSSTHLGILIEITLSTLRRLPHSQLDKATSSSYASYQIRMLG